MPILSFKRRRCFDYTGPSSDVQRRIELALRNRERRAAFYLKRGARAYAQCRRRNNPRTLLLIEGPVHAPA